MKISIRDEEYNFTPWKPQFGKVMQGTVAIDTETTLITSKTQPPSYVLGAAFDGSKGVFIQRQHLANFLKAHGACQFCFHNATFDLSVINAVVAGELDVYSFVDQNRILDTQILFKLLTLAVYGHPANKKGESTLDSCVEKILEIQLAKDISDRDGNDVRTSFGKYLGVDPRNIDPVYLEYLGLDTIVTFELLRSLISRINNVVAEAQGAFGYVDQRRMNAQSEKWGLLTHHIQLKATIVLDQITKVGIGVDAEKVEQIKLELESRQQEIEENLRGSGWIIRGKNSSKSLQNVIRRLAQRNPTYNFPRTPTGLFATSSEALSDLMGIEFVGQYLEYKANQKLLSTFLNKMNRSRLHPSFTPLQRSGRTSSFGEINSQNLPRDQRIRNCFVPSDNMIFVICDYSTLELATLAQAVLDQFDFGSYMATRINNGEDLHRLVASHFAKKEIAEVTAEDRQKAKPINFGKPGGMGDRGLIRYAKLSYGVQLSEDDVRQLTECWFDLFPEMRSYLERAESPGVAIARFLNLTPAQHHRQTGDSRCLDRCGFHNERFQPSDVLGWMCRKVAADRHPVTRNGQAYARQDVDFFWRALRENIEVFSASEQIAIRQKQPSKTLAQELCRIADLKPCITATGRIRGRTGYCARRNTLFQGLAADGAKLAMWGLWRAGFKIVNFIHDEFLIEVDEDEFVPEKTNQIRQIMIDEMRRVTPDVSIEVDAKVANCWTKDDTFLNLAEGAFC